MLSSLFPHRKFIRLDGGMGSMLQKGGMPVGALPEVYNITEPERIIDAQKQFVAVGSDIIYANLRGKPAQNGKIRLFCPGTDRRRHRLRPESLRRNGDQGGAGHRPDRTAAGTAGNADL